ncbi:MAG: aldehyde dehydrogenase family protein, partial [Candidatus Thalassarchaeaceae archaeon]|nr:aldehyde dehydrogenase family protein [Candidatus Thalassarchaeaceae archaeon]
MHTRDQLYIDGKWVLPMGNESIDVINPATEEIIGKIPVGSVEDIDKAASAARIAFESWSKSSIESRIDILNGLSNALKERGEEIAQT